jgi:Icc protein
MLRIALMGDLHYPELGGNEAHLRDAKAQFYGHYVKEFMDTQADLHISIGDLTHNGFAEEFRDVYRVVRESGVHFRQVLGNHDVLAMRKEAILAITKQPRYEALDTEHALIVLLDTTLELDLYGWGLDAEQWDWLELKMSEAGEKPVLVFAHHPVPGTTAESPEPGAEFAPYQNIRSLLDKSSGGGLFFNGHTHTHHIVTQGKWHFIQTAAALCDPCFRLIEIDTDEIRVRTIPAAHEDIMRSRSILHEQLSGFHRPPDFAREQRDLIHQVPLSPRFPSQIVER